jgi:hypothetical protein
MTKHPEILTLENPRREAARHRRTQPRLANQVPRLIAKDANIRRHEESTPRFRFNSTAPSIRLGRSTSPMRVLLRNAKTMKFFHSAERWTNDPRQARDFHNGWWATVCAFTMNPRHLVIQYEFDDDRYNLHIPVLGHPHA